MAPASVMQIDLWKGHETELKNLKRDLRKAKSSFGSVADREALLAGATSDDVCSSQLFASGLTLTVGRDGSSDSPPARRREGGEHL